MPWYHLSKGNYHFVHFSNQDILQFQSHFIIFGLQFHYFSIVFWSHNFFKGKNGPLRRHYVIAHLMWGLLEHHIIFQITKVNHVTDHFLVTHISNPCIFGPSICNSYIFHSSSKSPYGIDFDNVQRQLVLQQAILDELRR